LLCLLLCSVVLVISSGCNGVVRYKTLGFQESATVSLYNQTTEYLIPIMLPAGGIIDTGIFVADVAANPFCALWMVSQGPDPGASFHPIAILVMPLYWCFTPVAMAALPFLNRDFYSSSYGCEGHWIEKQKEKSQTECKDTEVDE